MVVLVRVLVVEVGAEKTMADGALDIRLQLFQLHLPFQIPAYHGRIVDRRYRKGERAASLGGACELARLYVAEVEQDEKHRRLFRRKFRSLTPCRHGEH